MSLPAAAPALDLRGVSKTFSGRRVLSEVDLAVRPGEVHGLVGQNGSGKSTLIKILAGYHRPDEGARGLASGVSFELGSVAAAAGAHLRFVHQDLALVLELNAVDNVALGGGYARRFGLIDWRAQRRETMAALARFGVTVNPDIPLAQLPTVERTAVAIARSLVGWNHTAGVLVLDEPTAALPASEAERLHDIVHEIVAEGASVIYVSHRLDDVIAAADRISVLRNGRLVGTYPSQTTSALELAEQMVGHEVTQNRTVPDLPEATSQPLLSVSGVQSRWLNDISFQMRSGEIVGVAGVLGSGRDELPYVVASATRTVRAGTVQLDGSVLKHGDPRGVQAHGVGFVPSDRAREAVFAPCTLRENMSIASLETVSRAGFIRREAESSRTKEWMERVQVDPPRMDLMLPKFSGGNQQKAILARILARRPRLLVLSEPTAGVDIGAREALYDVVRDAVRDRGLGVLVASSDIGDLVAICHRVLILRSGVITGELVGDAITYANVVKATEGAANDVLRLIEEEA